MTTPMSSPLDGNGVAAAEAAFNASINNPQMVPCSKCEGRGFHHGFGEDGNDPDWCTECGGNQFNVVPGEETRAIEAAVAAYLAAAAPSHTAVEPVGELVERLRDIVTEFDNEVADMMSNDGAERADLWVDVDVPIGIVRQADSALTAQAAALVAANERVQALMAERTNIIATKRDQLAAAESEVATLKARVAELEAGLEPFARMFDEWMRDYPDGGEKEEPPAGKHAWGFNGTDLLWGDFIRARRLTHQEKNNGR